MKTAFFILIVVSFIITSCSHYTCPTYAKKEKNKAIKDKNI